MKLESFRDLKVWQKGVEIVNAVYAVSKQLPKSELYGLSNQVQRSAVSIPSNIAEGYARKGTAEYLHYLSMAYGSAAELETQLIIINNEYSYVHTDSAKVLLMEVQKMLYVLMQKLKSKSASYKP